MLQYVAVCCGALRRAAVSGSLFQVAECVSMCCSVLPYVPYVLQCVAICRSFNVLPYVRVAVCCHMCHMCDAVCFNVLPYVRVAMCCHMSDRPKLKDCHVCLFMCLFSCVSFHVSLFMCLFSCVSFHMSLFMCLFSCVSFHVSLLMCLFSCFSLHVSLCMSWNSFAVLLFVQV